LYGRYPVTNIRIKETKTKKQTIETSEAKSSTRYRSERTTSLQYRTVP
jgi:hypothetical protein